MHAAGVVTDHAAESAAVMRSRVGSEGEVMFLSGVPQMIENHTWLDAGNAAGRINFQNASHVFGKIQHDSDVAALASKRCASATTKEGSAELAAERDTGQNIIRVPGKHQPDRNLTVAGSIGGVEGAAGAIKANLAAHLTAQGRLQPRRIHDGGFRGAGDLCILIWHVLCAQSEELLLPTLPVTLTIWIRVSPSRGSIVMVSMFFLSVETMV